MGAVLVPLLSLCFMLSSAISSNPEATNNNFVNAFAFNIQDLIVKNDLNISEECRTALGYYASSLVHAESWALEMFDASGKFPSGIISGNAGDLGDFDQCLDVQHTTAEVSINGKYCLGKFKIVPDTNSSLAQLLPKKSPKNIKLSSIQQLVTGACLPHSCSTDDIQKFYSAFGMRVAYSEHKCQIKALQPKLDGVAIGTIAFLGFIAGIMLVSTIYDVFLHVTNRKSHLPILIAFSVFTNGRKLLQTSNDGKQIQCIHGLRVISMMWIILGHRYRMYILEILLANQIDVIEWLKNSWFMTGGTVAVDTFFMLSGLVVSYTFMGAVAKKMEFNLFVYYLHRYLRLTPAYAAVILINVSLMKHLGSGPQWPSLVYKLLQEPCRNYWWSALLYVQNYVNPNQMCMGQTWYLSDDMQLYLISPLLLLSFLKWPRMTPYVLGTVIIVAALIPFSVSWVYGFHAIVDPFQAEEHVRDLYFPTHTRAAPWFVGLATGYILRHPNQILKGRTKTQIHFLNLVLLMVTFAVLCACDFGSSGIINGKYNRLTHSMYTAFVPLAWAAALGYLIFVCVNGYGGPINWILSNPLMRILSRLSYSMYLLHKLVLSIQIYRFRNAAVFGNMEIMTVFWGDFIYTLVLAVVWVLGFESPVMIIEKTFLFPTRKVKK